MPTSKLTDRQLLAELRRRLKHARPASLTAAMAIVLIITLEANVRP
jgi:hypothetical protein